MIDLRSDTVTKPCEGMRRAMAAAEVGDDVFGDDKTVNALEERLADMAGKEAAMFVPSGTMGNQICLRLIAPAGSEVIAHENSHIIHYEAGATAALSGITVNAIRGNYGFFNSGDVLEAIRPLHDVHAAPAAAIVIENTNNRGGGTIWSRDTISEIAAVAKNHDLKMHLDGARIWNAMAATECDLRSWTQFFETATVCFSKGLGAPVGSAVLSSKSQIQKARRIRKMFGGGMRQAGILAAACLYALDNNLSRLPEDHRKARRLAELLGDSTAINVETATPATNMVFFHVDTETVDPSELLDACYQESVRFSHTGKGRYRAVTHKDVSDREIQNGAEVIIAAVKRLKK